MTDTNTVVPSPASTSSPVAPSPGDIPNPLTGTQAEYANLLSLFKYLITLTGSAVTLLFAIGGFLFYSNLKDVRQDAKQQAIDIATSEAKAAVVKAFDEKNVNDLIFKAAQEKVGTITDKMIEQQLTSKLRPVQQRITLIGQISEDGSRMRLGFRTGMDDLNHLINSTNDPDVVTFGKKALDTLIEDYELRSHESFESLKQTGLSGVPALQRIVIGNHGPTAKLPNNFHDVVDIIQHDDNLNVVAAGFLIFRDVSGQRVKMFDFDSVARWCSQNPGKC